MGGDFPSRRTQCTLLFLLPTATPEFYTLSLHDALPISLPDRVLTAVDLALWDLAGRVLGQPEDPDRKSTRLNSSHGSISYAVFCLENKNDRLIIDSSDNSAKKPASLDHLNLALSRPQGV